MNNLKYLLYRIMGFIIGYIPIWYFGRVLLYLELIGVGIFFILKKFKWKYLNGIYSVIFITNCVMFLWLSYSVSVFGFSSQIADLVWLFLGLIWMFIKMGGLSIGFLMLYNLMNIFIFWPIKDDNLFISPASTTMFQFLVNVILFVLSVIFLVSYYDKEDKALKSS